MKESLLAGRGSSQIFAGQSLPCRLLSAKRVIARRVWRLVAQRKGTVRDMPGASATGTTTLISAMNCSQIWERSRVGPSSVDDLGEDDFADP